ncbi:hypothetical protein CONPUDRAFT_142711 [Coniophora puteana RWD-64-598 SS2]|uniref:DUF7918 domain-containing protein n=1 Tax=Coniophora puteana (strain RWD-64-598) TaxID=741705 RepID=A0A5M3N022_CONPW|nr:uncharacterized protein CONPUDRAFT_142711 [Coniophora puteana RWD-64-598 SS2]EIW84404.1 hypothetical protein CONPUDRAFT_142711 [Coniophora puteana RWD-64-598 SS2]
MRLGDFSASVIVDGSPLEEYDVVVGEDEQEITCYIPSNTGKKFSVKWTDWVWERGLDSCGYVSVDGLKCIGRVLDTTKESTAERSEFHIDEETARDLMFSDLKLTDDDSYLRTPGLEKLGEISIEIWRGKCMGPGASRFIFRKAPSDDRIVHERTKKAMVHCVSFAEERKLLYPIHPIHFHFLGSHPVARFIFKYKPLASTAVLQAQGIALSPIASHSPTSERVNFAPVILDMNTRKGTISSRRHVSARIRALELEVSRLQRKRSSHTAVSVRSDERPAKRIKYEGLLKLSALAHRKSSARPQPKAFGPLALTVHLNLNPLMRVGDFSACIVVDGSPLDEYNVMVDQAKLNATCWIPSQSGKNFTVRWTCLLRERPYDSSGRVSVDGGPMRRTDTKERSGVEVGRWNTRDFMFSDVRLTDDETHFHTRGIERLGEISLLIERGRVGAWTEYREVQAGARDGCTVHERSKKAVVHCVGFGEVRYSSRPVRPRRFFSTYPEVKFLFKYGPLPVLQAQGIAPPSVQKSQEGGPQELEASVGGTSGSGLPTTESTQVSKAVENTVRRESDRSVSIDSNVTIINARINALEVELTQIREARARAAGSATVAKSDPDERPH